MVGDFKQKLEKFFDPKNKGKSSEKEHSSSPGSSFPSWRQLTSGGISSFTSAKNKPQKLLSIDFGPYFISIACLERFSGSLKLLDYDFKKIQTLDGQKDKAIEFINKFIQKKDVQEKDTYLSIPLSGDVVIKHFVLPVIPRGEILETLKWQFKDEILFDLGEAIIDWKIVKEYTDEDGARRNEIVCIVGKKEIISAYLSVIEECDLLPLGMSTYPFNYANILGHLGDKSKIKVLLHIADTETTLCFYEDAQLRFLRKLPFFPEKLISSLVTTFASDKGVVKLSRRDAEKLIETYGIPRIQKKSFMQGIPVLQVLSLMRPHLELLVREIKVTFNYFTEHFNEDAPSNVYLAGVGSDLKNLDKYLAEEIEATVFLLSMPDSVSTTSVTKKNLKVDYKHIASALGAALPGPHEVNVLPIEFKLLKFKAAAGVFLKLGCITVAVIFIVSLFMVRYRLKDYQNRLKHNKVYLQNIEDVKVFVRKIKTRKAAIAAMQKDHVPVEGLLKTVSALLPAEIILDSLALDQVKHNLLLKGRVIKGAKLAEAVLAEFMRSIESSAFFTEASLLSSEKKDNVQVFELKCDLVKWN